METLPATFGVLGPLQVHAGGAALDVPAPRLRLVLALLVAAAGQVVSVATIAERLWDGHPPPQARRSVRTYVSLLRTALRPAGELIETSPPGYVLRVPPQAVDASRFERLVAGGQRALADGQPALARRELDGALGLWRGPAYAEFASVPALWTEGRRLERLRLTARQDRIEADLASGRGPELVAELADLTTEHPADERLWGQLMRALYRAGRQADALAAYRCALATLVEHSGVDPSPALNELHRRILAHDPDLLPGQPAARPPLRLSRIGPPPPAQLPRGVHAFTGRQRELAALGAGPGALTVLSGSGGVGKTALALHWAQQVMHRFADGQLYVDLLGFGPAGRALEPAAAIRGFLAALGVPADRIPPGLDAQAALYRSLLAGRRALVVLDNARDADQVRPLLPGAPYCAVVVTSRDQLASLVATEGARHLSVDVLGADQARELLARRLGAARVAAEPQAVAAIAARCAYLPLALTIAAARAVTQPALPLAAFAAELATAGDRLDVLTTGDSSTDLRAVYSWSYQRLSGPAARLFRLLGAHPGSQVSARAMAVMAGQPDVRAPLRELTAASLLTEVSPARYACHDLLRAYAADLARTAATGIELETALDRLLSHYLRTAYDAERLLRPGRDPLPLPLPAEPGSDPQPLADQEEATAWLAVERGTLLATLQLAANQGRAAYVCQLAWALDTFLYRRGHWHERAAIWRTALDGALRDGDPATLVIAHRGLAWASTMVGDHRTALAHYLDAIDGYARAGDLAGQALVHQSLGYAWGRQAQHVRAVAEQRRAHELFRLAGHRRGQAGTLNNIGWSLAQLGEYGPARQHCTQALTLQRADGDGSGEADTWDSLGYVYHHLGDQARSADCYHRALALFRAWGDLYKQACTLAHLGDTMAAAGSRGAARGFWRAALDILAGLDSVEAQGVRARLEGGQPPAAAGTPAIAGSHPGVGA